MVDFIFDLLEAFIFCIVGFFLYLLFFDRFR